MTRIGFTGTRSTAGREDEIRSWIDTRLPVDEKNPGRGIEFTTGACVGFDSLAARWLLASFPYATHRLIVPSNRSQIDANLLALFAAAQIPGWCVIEFMPHGTSYKDRNLRILQYTDRLIACADYPEKHGKSRRSGTWQTVRLFEDLLVADLLILNPEEA